MSDQSLQRLALTAIEKSFTVALAQIGPGDRFCIYGAGEVGRILLHLCRAQGCEPLAFLDDLSDVKAVDGIPVMVVQEGIEKVQPQLVVLGSIRALDRMRANLKQVPFLGTVVSVEDANAHMRSPHCSYTTTPKDVVQQFRNRHEGRRAFVIGNGPSLLRTDPRRLMERNEITFAANNIFLLEGFEPTYYTAIDRVLTQDRAKEINALPWVKFFPHLVSEWITNGLFLNAIHAEWPGNFSGDITEYIEIDFTVTYSMLQIAFFMGCNPVYLIGVDHTYVVDQKVCHQEEGILTSVSDDPNHFHPGYFGKGYRWSKPRMEPLQACYNVALDFYKAHGRTLFNATAGGALEKVPRAEFESLL